MRLMPAILGTYIKFGTTADTVPISLRRNVWIMVLLAPLFYIAALTQLPAPLDPFRGAFGTGIAVMSWTGTAVMTAATLVSTLLLLTGRAVGVLSVVPVFMYGNPIISALMISVVPMGSLSLLLGTLALAVWSVVGVLKVNGKISDDTILALRQERLFIENGRTHLLPGTALEGGGLATTALSGLRSVMATVLEFAGAFVLLLFGGVLVPVAIATDASSSGWIAPVLWLACTSLFLAGRGSVNMMLLLGRVLARGPVATERVR